MNNPKRVALYIRSNQSNKNIADQVNPLAQACVDQGKCLVQIYMDRGISGLCLNPPSLLRMLEDAENGLFEEVMVHNLSRLSRRSIDVLTITKKLRAASVDLTVPDSRLDLNSASGRFAFQMMEATVELELYLQEGSE
ncbi:recombinase family protein [Cohnella faecalis]|uniref:Recombinase family protein n=1 Tax=Cohnella faecalis TaxID=2315694 RepID=A0A398CJZ4_9BACL|nr:recombinase family protein [Cohnella faecalis]RIE01509.1 recombinase family protein [Cohnella faecalis]